MPGAQGRQKKVSGPLELANGCVSPFGYWEFKLDPLQKEQESEAILKQESCQHHNDLLDLQSSPCEPILPSV